MYPRVHRSVGLARRGSPKMLTGDSPTCDLQLDAVAILQVRFSAQEIDASASRQAFQRLINGPWRSDFQEAAVPDIILLKQLFQRHCIDFRGSEGTLMGRRQPQALFTLRIPTERLV